MNMDYYSTLLDTWGRYDYVTADRPRSFWRWKPVATALFRDGNNNQEKLFVNFICPKLYFYPDKTEKQGTL